MFIWIQCCDLGSSCDQEDILKSLESRLDIMCDEADRELESDTNDIQEIDNHVSTDKFVPNLDLQVQRYILIR